MFFVFGLVAVAGSYYVQTERLRPLAIGLAVPVGLLAAAILMVNNVRDVDTDRRARKRTLAVRLGRLGARRLFAATLLAVVAATIVLAATAGEPWLLLGLGAVPLMPPLLRTVGTRVDGPSLNAALAASGRLLAVYALLMSAGLLLS